jgi:hypothetical protein
MVVTELKRHSSNKHTESIVSLSTAINDHSICDSLDILAQHSQFEAWMYGKTKMITTHKKLTALPRHKLIWRYWRAIAQLRAINLDIFVRVVLFKWLLQFGQFKKQFVSWSCWLNSVFDYRSFPNKI